MAQRRSRRSVVAVALWAACLLVVWVVGLLLQRAGSVVTYGGAPPLLGHLRVRVTVGTLAAVLVAGLVVWRGPAFARSARWGVLLLAAWAATAAFAVALATTDGWSALTAPLRGEHDYLAVVPVATSDLGEFLRTFTERAPDYPVHVRGHPPAFPLLLAALDRLGLGGAGWATALVVTVGSSAVVAVAVTLRALAGRHGDDVVRRALPAVVVAPAALWVVTSADAFFAGVLAWGIALLSVASTRPPGRRSWPWALGAGLVLGLCPFLSYGLLPMGALALVVGFTTTRWRPTVLAGLVVLGSAAAWAWAGFRLTDGLAVTHVASSLGRAADRPYLYFVVADLLVLGLLVGPAGVGGLARLPRLPRPVTSLVLVALGAAVVGALSGVERGEVERIWVPLACWILPAAAAVAPGRRWLLAQAGTAVLLQVVLVSPW